MLLFKLFDCISLLTTDDTLHRWMVQFAVHHHHTSSKKKDNFTELADKGLYESLKLIDGSGWKEESKNEKDVLYSKNIPEIGKVFKYEGIVEVDAETINDKLYYNIERSPEWNNSVDKVDVIQTVDNQTNIVRIITRNRFFVSSREFVHLRKWKKVGDSFVHSTFSIDHPEVPSDLSFTRGEHRFCTYVIQPLKEDPSKTRLVWLMQVNLKGWLPQQIIDQAVSFGMESHFEDIRTFRKS
ncbi:hypothetical protein JTE90_011013 [Oedothorax gibbosus]|uniref:START domain-containing protein n=1 Tax=Oedothorax gibbosus TaxID=931172 RepID=A0AAV6VFB0_9ARAC|nr:hypothetical protein JTE90_011013 [Oedothorax gibbosus]